ncbi:unnamed protein product [Rotaria magnacalcarata]|uniref:Protein artemis n=1 Tax=Rotaria magnacalcarata TaxID=392030 RepID=A0A8S3F0Q0_9BILA|nr:unnamed protein product [Rotaria magnacalcarata]
MVVQSIEQYLFEGQSNARVGYEQIYRALYDGLGMRIHVEQGQYDFYSCIPLIQECLTTDPSTTRLHACRTSASNFAQPCAFFRNCDKPIRVLLSIMWFTDQIAAGELLVEYHKYHSNFEQSVSTSNKRYFIGFQDYGGEGVDVSYSDKYLSYRLCYSLHSSFSEIADVLKTLKPKRVTPIAAPFTSQLTPKRLFQIIDHYIQDPNKPKATITEGKLIERIQRKPINQQLQVKHRYESFQTKAERKRKKKLIQEQQLRKDNDDELDLDINSEAEKQLLQRVNSLKESLSKKIKTTESKPIIRSISFDLLTSEDNLQRATSSKSSQSSQIFPLELKSEDTPHANNSNTSLNKDSILSDIMPLTSDQSVDLPCSDGNRQRTSSDSSSDTVDYDFDTETCTAITSTSIDTII